MDVSAACLLDVFHLVKVCAEHCRCRSGLLTVSDLSSYFAVRCFISHQYRLGYCRSSCRSRSQVGVRSAALLCKTGWIWKANWLNAELEIERDRVCVLQWRENARRGIASDTSRWLHAQHKENITTARGLPHHQMTAILAEEKEKQSTGQSRPVSGPKLRQE